MGERAGKADMSWTPTWPEKTKLDKLHTRLQWISTLFIVAMKDYGSAATVNFGPDDTTTTADGVHSKKSAHGDNRAVDINHRDLRFPWASYDDKRAWFAAGYSLAGQLVRIANLLTKAVNHEEVEYYLVVEASHWHLEIALNGALPNIKGWEKGKYIYATEEVKKIIGGPGGQGIT